MEKIKKKKRKQILSAFILTLYIKKVFNYLYILATIFNNIYPKKHGMNVAKKYPYLINNNN